MSRPRLWVSVWAATIVMLGAGACGGDARYLPKGDFAGSTSADQPYRISIGDKLKVNNKKAEFDGRGKLRLMQVKGRPVISCITQAQREELRCVVPKADGSGTETIELMRE
ncbi:MAG: hypothetical protein QOK43_780 [Acidimicrobiaceae bacterium]|nr:hypothetical protein [Acidimicrobiaceae bacterium]